MKNFETKRQKKYINRKKKFCSEAFNGFFIIKPHRVINKRPVHTFLFVRFLLCHVALWNLGQLAPASFFYLQQAHGRHVWDIYVVEQPTYMVKMVPEKNGPRKNVLQKLFSVKKMLGNLNDFLIFIDWFHYTHKKKFTSRSYICTKL